VAEAGSAEARAQRGAGVFTLLQQDQVMQTVSELLSTRNIRW